MLIIKLTETKETLDDIERICRHLSEHKDLVKLMTPEESRDISYILRPTFNANHNEDQKRAHWQKLLNEFTVTDKKGNELRFFRDQTTEALYFGNQQGFDTLESMSTH